MSNLDNMEAMKALDPDGMYGAIAGFPEQIRGAVGVGETLSIEPSRFDGIKNIVVCGMGGSAIGGDLVRSILSDSLPYPMHICRNYHLPAFADDSTLVIASSYSGSTEETLSAVEEAIVKKCRVVGITTGGRLGELCGEHIFPMMTLPPGMQPRAALGYSFVPLMILFHRLGLSSYGSGDFLKLADFLESRMPLFTYDNPSDDNPCKQLAMQLYGRLPIIYSGPEITDAVATRFKGQICENAKMLAFANQFAEFNHNELVGWKVINAFRDYLRVVVLRDSEDNPRISARMDIVGKLINDQKVNVINIRSEGGNRLERMMSLIQFGDFTSFYLAVLNKVDPSPVKVIDYLKEELAKLA